MKWNETCFSKTHPYSSYLLFFFSYLYHSVMLSLLFFKFNAKKNFMHNGFIKHYICIV